MELNGFVNEELLNKMFLANDITELDYVKRHSQGMLDAYTSFIEENDLPDNVESAAKFLDEENVSYGEMEMEDEAVQQEKDNDSISVAIYRKWVEEKDRVNILLGGCEEAAVITLWRYKNPEGDMDECGDNLLLDKEQVEKWWNTIEFVNGSLGGGHFTLLNPTLDNIKELIYDATNQAIM